jgi:hypothetical protein
MKYLTKIAVVLSLALVGYELNQNQQPLLESNNLGRIEVSNNHFVGNSATRESILKNVEV